jgi:hypothetical protein
MFACRCHPTAPERMTPRFLLWNRVLSERPQRLLQLVGPRFALDFVLTCDALGVPRCSYYRSRRPPSPKPKKPRPRPRAIGYRPTVTYT